MNENGLREMLEKFKDISIAVIGDFFLDKYLVIDPAKDEPSLETGLTAYQVVEKVLGPGAAGTVTNNLRALGIGKVISLGFVGDDGEGYELIRGLEATGVDTGHMIRSGERVTPTYIKPVIDEDCRKREINRLDIKNRSRMPVALEDQIIGRLVDLSDRVDAIIAIDQVVEDNCGVITEGVREVLAQLGRSREDLIIYADSRINTSLFRDIIVKCNNYEAIKAVKPDGEGEPDDDMDDDIVKDCGMKLMKRTGKPVFITLGKRGQVVIKENGIEEVPAIHVEGPTDICGAGDAVTSGIVSALCCGASFSDAALLGNIVASITIQQLGTTGTASPAQILGRYREAFPDRT